MVKVLEEGVSKICLKFRMETVMSVVVMEDGEGIGGGGQ